MNRFLWIDKNTIKIMNKEGIEKILDVSNKFAEVEYNKVPIYNNEEVREDPLFHYYKNRKSLPISAVLNRLKRKYQCYKSAYYLDHKRDPESLYPMMYTVDY
jgi:hypothetical protein